MWSRQLYDPLSHLGPHDVTSGRFSQSSDDLSEVNTSPNADDECTGFNTPCMQNLRKIQVLSKCSCFFFRKFAKAAKGGVEPAAGGKLSGNFGSFRMDLFFVGVCCCSKA